MFPNPGKNGSWDGHQHGDGIMWRTDILQHLQQRNVTDGLSNTFMIGEDSPERNRWCSWPYANNAYGTCAIPPNFTWQETSWWPNTHSFRSSHPNGLNFALADGSVRFVSVEITLQTYRALATRAGGERVSDF
jgi:prepilin-type processing-associated H-X9-DG protein